LTKRRIIGLTIAIVAGIYPGLFLACNAHALLSGQRSILVNPRELLLRIQDTPNAKVFLGIYFILLFVFLGWSMVQSITLNYKSGWTQVAPGIRTPSPCGQNQYGSARWLTKREYPKAYFPIRLDPRNNTVKWLVSMGAADLEDGYDPTKDLPFNSMLFPQGGIVVGQKKNGKTLYVVEEDIHSLILGATRSSKSRSVVLPSICVTALAEESMVLSDPKGELYFYTAAFLRRLGYEVIAIDFEAPKKSTQYNFMQLVIDHLEEGNISAAKTAANELVEGLVGKGGHVNGESLWTEGEKSIMACCIMAVAYDNRNKPQYQNLTNVYHFISRMCAPQEGQSSLPLQEYLNGLPEEHPAKSLAGISNVAHVRTRSSFYASALATLRLFEDYNIADMTSRTGFDIYTTGITKRAVFMILPDETDVFYPVASLFVHQHYQTLVRVAKKNGGRLPRRVEFFLDEMGNFAHIPSFEKLLTVGGGRGIRFHLFLQGLKQLDETYNQNVASIICSNCETWLYLRENDQETVEAISKKLGNYTTKTPNLSASLHGGGGSVSYSYTSRNLLTPDEVKGIVRPYQLVMGSHNPAILYAPDISRMVFNKMLGLGDQEHNLKLIMARNNARPERQIRPPQLWGIWQRYEAPLLREVEEAPEPVLFKMAF